MEPDNYSSVVDDTLEEGEAEEESEDSQAEVVKQINVVESEAALKAPGAESEQGEADEEEKEPEKELLEEV